MYLHGGPVCRISETGGSRNVFDYMVCDSDFCGLCGENRDMSKPSKTGGWPIVHSSATMREDGVTLFQPPNGHRGLEIVQPNYQRVVRFTTEDGEISVRAQVCGYVGCGTCEAENARN